MIVNYTNYLIKQNSPSWDGKQSYEDATLSLQLQTNFMNMEALSQYSNDIKNIANLII